MRDVAARAGVSQATVSFIVNDTKKVNAATRARVEQAMADLGFRPNELARALKSRSTRIIALAFPALLHSPSETAVTFFTSAAEAARERGYNLMLWPGHSGTIADLAKGGMVDGILLMEVEFDDPRVDMLTSLGTPFALIGRTRDPDAFPYVDIHFERILTEAVNRIGALGHREIALVLRKLGHDHLPSYAPTIRSEASFRQAIHDVGIDGSVHFCGASTDEGRQFASELLQANPGTTAVIVENERAAVGLVGGLTSLGKRIPQDISVLLANSTTDIAHMTEPRLAVMVTPGERLGRMGVETLIDILEGRSTALRHELAMANFEDGPSLDVAPTPH